MAEGTAELIVDAVADAKRQLLAIARADVHVPLPDLALLQASWPDGDGDTLRLLATAVNTTAPRHVIEFGCGVTTELLAHLACEHGRMAMTCVEHDPWAAAEFVELAGGLALNYRWFSFCICPLVARRIGDRLLPVYDDRMSAPTVPYPGDLIVINGPPEVLGGRAGMMYQALTYARVGTVVLILNARKGEASMFEAWLRDLKPHIEFVPPGFLGRHLAFVVREPLPDAFSLEAPMAQMAAESERAALEARGAPTDV